MKGADMCFVQITKEGIEEKALRYDEFQQIRLTRHITSVEAFMSIYGVPLVHRSHLVDELDVHGPEGHRIAVEEGEEEEVAVAEEERIKHGEERTTQLTAYFNFNRNTPILKQATKNSGRGTIEIDIRNLLQKLRYDLHKREWKFYIQTQLAGQKLCRLKTVSPSNLELLAIRQLLFVVEDPTDWVDLRTTNCRIHTTFIEAAKERGILIDNILWKNTIIEAFETKKTARQCIRWLAVFFATANLSNSAELLDEILQMPNNWLVNTRVAGASLDARRQYVLQALEWFLREHGIEPDDIPRADGIYETACEHIGLPKPQNINVGQDDYISLQFNRDHMINEKLDPELRDPELTNKSMQQRYNELFLNGPQPNEEQKSLIQEIQHALIDAANVIDGKTRQFNTSIPRMFMVTGEGGAGKTFTYNKIIALVKSAGFTFLPTATTGIAAELLYEGQTVHKRICRRKHVNSSSTVNIDYDSRFAEFLRRTHGILIDEISMQHKDVIEHVDKLLRSIAPSEYLKNIPFAGKVIVLGGDWKQLAPVVPGGGHLDQLNASVKNSTLFAHFVTRKLLANHRLRPGQDKYRNFLLRVGTGKSNIDHRVQLRATLCVQNRDALLDFVFPTEMLQNPLDHAEQFGGCAILAPLNSETFALNNIIMERICGNERMYIATTQPVRDDTGQTELLNVAADVDCENLTRMTPQGVPEHRLRIKIGAIMMIITNISIADGLCNGTRVQILPGPKGRLTKHIIRCRILSGNKRGNEHELHPARFVFGGDPEAVHQGPIKCERIQFPLRPGSVMTINKSQGQTLQRVGLLLDQSQCFSHGQLYVALSRVKEEADIRICTKHTQHKVKNVVIQELLDQQDLENAQKLPKDPQLKDDNESDLESEKSMEDVDGEHDSVAVAALTSAHKRLTKFVPQLDLAGICKQHLNKITVVKGDITRQQVDLIVNATNAQLKRGSGVDDAIHRACQPHMDTLEQALKLLHMSNGCDFPNGCVVTTEAYGELKKNVKYIAHAVGPLVRSLPPIEEQITSLKVCYGRALDALIDKNGKSIAFPAISTGAFGFPRDTAAKSAIEAVLKWLCTHPKAEQVEKIIFVYFRKHEEQLGLDLLELAKRQLCSRSTTPSQMSTPRSSRIRIPLSNTFPGDIVQRLERMGSVLSQQDQAGTSTKFDEVNQHEITSSSSRASTNKQTLCYDVKGDGDCFYRAVCFSLFGTDDEKNSDALRRSASSCIRTIVNNQNFFPRSRHPTHADFVKELRNALIATSGIPNGEALINYANQMERAARLRGADNYSGWAQVDDAHTIAILLCRPVVVVQPFSDYHTLRTYGPPDWNDQSVQQTLTVYFPDGERMFQMRVIEHANLLHFTTSRRGKRDERVERVVQNPIVLWFNGLNHFQCLYFQPNPPNHVDGREFIGIEEIDVPPNFIS